MHVAVIGCGLAGISTAYFLHRAGASVTVLDRAPAAGREASYANGALLTPSLADPWNAPGALTDLLRSLGRDDAAMLLHLGQVPRLGFWGLRFLLNSRPARFQESFLHNVRLARYSLELLGEIESHTGIGFEHAPSGIVKVFEGEESFRKGVAVAHWLKQAQIRHEVLDRQALLALEPALAPGGERLIGGVLYPDDEVGNARLYCEALTAWLRGEGVNFRFSELVRGFAAGRGGIVSLATARGMLNVDAVVLAAGSYSRPLGRMLGMRLPVVPAKGYSITVPVSEADRAGCLPSRPVVDDALHAAVVPLGGDRLRVAGTAEFSGFDLTVRPERIDNLKHLLGRVLPQVTLPAKDPASWAGLRPMTPDGRPVLGGSRVPNLFVNTGHGALGWTLAAGSGKVVADLVMGEGSAHDVAPFLMSRF